MKKNYFLIALFALSSVGVFAQNFDFEDDMESYTPGSVIFQDQWTSWSGTPADAILSSSDQANSGAQSGYVDDSGTMDAVLDLGNKIFGTWGLEMYMYVPSGREAYMNFQGEVPIGGGTFPVGNIYFNEGGTNAGAGYIDYSTGDTSVWSNFTYPEDQWFRIIANFDVSGGISTATWQFYVNDVEVVPAGSPFASWDATNMVWDYSDTISIGGVDFFSISTNNTYYVDDVRYADAFFDPTASTQDFAAKGFSAYPNPVSDKLNIQAKENINSVVVYNVLGQQVYNANVDALSSQIDMSRMASGAYFVKVNVNGTEGTVKVIK